MHPSHPSTFQRPTPTCTASCGARVGSINSSSPRRGSEAAAAAMGEPDAARARAEMAMRPKAPARLAICVYVWCVWRAPLRADWMETVVAAASSSRGADDASSSGAGWLPAGKTERQAGPARRTHLLGSIGSVGMDESRLDCRALRPTCPRESIVIRTHTPVDIRGRPLFFSERRSRREQKRADARKASRCRPTLRTHGHGAALWCMAGRALHTIFCSMVRAAARRPRTHAKIEGLSPLDRSNASNFPLFRLDHFDRSRSVHLDPSAARGGRTECPQPSD